MDYINLTIDGFNCIQRTPISKIIIYDKHGKIFEKYDDYKDMSGYYYKVFSCIKDMENNPQKYFEYENIENDDAIMINDIKRFDIPVHIRLPDYIEGKPVLFIEEDLFSETDELSMALKQVQLPSFLEEIPSFQNTNIQTITIPDKINIIPIYCFDCCGKLNSVTFPEGLERISYGAFAECEMITEFTAPSKLKYIDAFAFFRTGLKTLTLNENLEYIDNSAFKSCNLRNISMHEKVKYHPWAFEYNDIFKIKTVKKDIKEDKER